MMSPFLQCTNPVIRTLLVLCVYCTYLVCHMGHAESMKQILEQGRYSELIQRIEEVQKNQNSEAAIKDKKDYWLIHFKGHAQYGLGLLNAARESFANAINSPFASVFDYENYAALLLFQSHHYEAVEALHQSFKILPGVQSNRSPAPRYALLHRAKMAAVAWEGLDLLEDKLDAHINDAHLGGKLPLVKASEYHAPSLSSRKLLTAAISAGYPKKSQFPTREQLLSHVEQRSLKIGFLSGNFGQHPVGRLIADLLQHLQKSPIHTVIFSRTLQKPSDDPLMSYKRSNDSFKEVGDYDSREIANLISEERLDILYDLDGHTLNGSPTVLSQISNCIVTEFLGYPGTTWLDSVNFLMADSTVISTEVSPQYFSERLVIVPETYLVSSISTLQAHVEHLPPANMMETIAGKLPLVNLSRRKVLSLLCPYYRVTPKAVETWSNIMRLVPATILWVVSSSTMEESERLIEQFEARGVSRNRIYWQTQIDHVDHVRQKSMTYLFLDGFQRSSHSATLDAVWAGVPTLSARGATMDSRGTSSIQRSVFCTLSDHGGLQPLCSLAAFSPIDTYSMKDYERFACLLGHGDNSMAFLKERLIRARREKVSKLYNSSVASTEFIGVNKMMLDICTFLGSGFKRNTCAHHVIYRPRLSV